MSRRFIVVSRAAAETMAADRFLQSCEFEQGSKLAAFLADELKDTIPVLPLVLIAPGSGGLCFVSRKSDRSDALVFDLEACPIFDARGRQETLLIFQKILRFALRYWGQQKFTASEHVVRGTTRGVLFPFPISTRSSFRVLIECAPDAARLARRPQIGRTLLVYWAGKGDHAVEGDAPQLTVFRKALAALSDARREAAKPSGSTNDEQGASAIALTRLEPLSNAIDGHLGFDVWDSILSITQRKFVHAALDGPHRIEGPAGSGKSICLVLRAIGHLRQAASTAAEHRSLFLAHSAATRNAVRSLFDANDTDGFANKDAYTDMQSIRVTTLHELCGDLLGEDIAESEFLDRDALESKNIQLLYVDEALTRVMAAEFLTYRSFLSPTVAELFEQEDRWALSQMLQHEISVIIKGRSEENLDSYKRVRRTRTGLPLRSESDRGFVFVIFKEYQRQLREASSFDTDDVVLSALGQLNTPIWRRRRAREGFDSIFLDETHLFNLNELSVLHHLTRSDSAFPISYATDPSQALEDRGWSDEGFDDALGYSGSAHADTTAVSAVFRCSPEIVNLAFCVTSSGATLFSNFDNPLRESSSAFTEADERLCASPLYRDCVGDEELVREAFARAETMATELRCGRSKIAIVVFDPTVLNEMKHHAAEVNKAVEVIVERGDVDAVRRATRAGRFVLCAPDYVGGLEFNGVVLVGVDAGRVPPEETASRAGSAAFLSYQAHSRLYVAITRARYRVEILGTLERGPSDLLRLAFERGAIRRSGEGSR